jgi:hypothetical protein
MVQRPEDGYNRKMQALPIGGAAPIGALGAEH